MSTTPGETPLSEQAGARSNDLSIEVATVNGSGSQTANQVLMRTLFQMGVPVSGKNMFPSNIAGLPTYFQIRAHHGGYTARKQDVDLMICMNPETAREDVARLVPGSLLMFDESLKLGGLRPDLVEYPVPFQQIVTKCCPDPKLHKLVKNMVYVGVTAQILGLDLDESRQALAKQLGDKPRAIEVNEAAILAGFSWAQENLPSQNRFRIVRDKQTVGQLIIDGNSACALGALFAGVSVVAWYPITPSSSLVETLIDYAERFRTEPETGKSNLAIVQMEDELASAGVLMGAGWAGARAMTATSGPGISLMSEMVGLGYFSEVPSVFVDVQRVGPSTGLPTRTSQSDITLCAQCSHGDARHICLYPATMAECFRFTYDAFDLAERFQTPVFVVSDLDLGMQSWVCDPFEYPEQALDRGKVLDERQLAEVQDWGRYRDVDGDGICYRTLPGTPGGKGAYFTRGSAHNANAQYTEKPADYVALMDRLRRKVENAKTWVPSPIVMGTGAKRGIIAFGSSHPAVLEARDLLESEAGLSTSYLRLRAFPFADEVEAFLRDMDAVYVVEQNRDGQMAGLLKEAFPAQAGKLRSVLHYDSLPITARVVTDLIAGFEK
jgi:2-oxoglutarate/2-oxoacid ferredoxin oxidoreductase subunit alpha